MWLWQRKVARRLEYSGTLHGGAVGFRQYFGSSLQLTPHLHVLMPEGLWTEAGEALPLPPPAVEDVEWVLRRVVKKLAEAFAEVNEAWPENGLELLRAKALQERLALSDEGARRQPRRVARVEGFNLHADTWVS